MASLFANLRSREPNRGGICGNRKANLMRSLANAKFAAQIWIVHLKYRPSLLTIEKAGKL